MADIHASNNSPDISSRPSIGFGADLTSRLQSATDLVGLFQAWRKRQKFHAMLDLDDEMLCDIGLTRFDIADGLKLPLRVNAAVEVRHQKALAKAAQKASLSKTAQ